MGPTGDRTKVSAPAADKHSYVKENLVFFQLYIVFVHRVMKFWLEDVRVSQCEARDGFPSEADIEHE